MPKRPIGQITVESILEFTSAAFDPEQAKVTRRAFLDKYCETDVLVCATHFPASSTGHIVRRDDAFWFQSEEANRR